MPSLREERITESINAAKAKMPKAREIAEKCEAENRPMTAEEKAVYDPIMAEAKSALDAKRGYEHDQSVFAFPRELSDNVVGGLSHDDLSSSGSGDKTRRLSFKGMGSHVARQMMPDGVKALAPSGASVVGQEMKPDPVALGQPALSLLDVIPVTTHAITGFAYMRQTVRTNNAAVVAEDAVKPTSVYTVVKVANSLVVVAHLSEGIPRFWLIHQVSLDTFISNELEYGLRQAVEAQRMTTTRHPWTTAELAALACCLDCDSNITVTETEPDVFTAVVSHDDSCPWFRAFVRSGADQIQLYTRDQS